MARVRLIHWKSDEAVELVRSLAGSDHTVDHEPLDPDALKNLKANPPDAIVIDLSRSPARGRDLWLLLRKARSTRCVPLVFVGGESEKVERVRELLPDAAFTTRRGASAALARALLRGAR